MGRKPRVEFKGVIYHVIKRTILSRETFVLTLLLLDVKLY